MFLSNYCAKDEFLAVKLEHECRICEILSWLEAAMFFATLTSNGGETTLVIRVM